jgi:UDP-N-acetylmuramate: L-alanyl-gamma-D-glutamyl-meso-diaminopimelate ligase
MHLHILGIGGTFMAGVALLARAAGHRVSGQDSGVYPPMSTQLAEQGIAFSEGFGTGELVPAPDCVVVGNVMTRGKPVIEALLDSPIPYTSGPQWLAEHILRGRTVLAVAGTHGKTTTASLLAWILEHAGRAPGFLIGGVPENFGVSARLGTGDCFVVEADEYDSAFFDKRAKFVHYRPRIAVLNNLEYDHADIYPDLAAIETQFHHLIRTVPGAGLIVVNGADANLTRVIERGCWTPRTRFALDADAEWQARLLAPDGSCFELMCQGVAVGHVAWPLLGAHNVMNALAAIAAADAVGVSAAQSIAALAGFRNVKRRLELRAEVGGIRIYDDFAHHPTAIAATLGALRARVGDARILALLEPRSNTMRLGVHKAQIAPALAAADHVLLYEPEGLGWKLDEIVAALGARGELCHGVEEMVAHSLGWVRPGDQVLIMSNGAFGGVHDKLITALRGRKSPS